MPVKLLWRNVLAHPLRALLTIGSVMVAVFLITLLDAAVAGLSSTVTQAANNRLVVQSAVSLFVDLPIAYQQKIAGVQGIEEICKLQWFGGRYEQDKGGFFAQFAVDADTFSGTYPEIELVEGAFGEFQKERTACIVGKDLAAKYGWQLGQTVPILGTIFQRTDGKPWEFTIRGIYRSTKTSVDQSTMYFRYDYLRESLEAGGARGPEGVGVYMLRVKPDADTVQVAAAVDTLFENGPQRVQTTTEAAFGAQFVSMLGDVPGLLKLIGFAVLFAIFFAVLNTMIMAGRERTRDAGVLKALGFSDATVSGMLVGEGLLLCGLGALFGALVVKALEAPFQALLSARLPGFAFTRESLLLGCGLAIAIGLVSGIVPGIRAARLTTVQALRELD